MNTRKSMEINISIHDIMSNFLGVIMAGVQSTTKQRIERPNRCQNFSLLVIARISRIDTNPCDLEAVDLSLACLAVAVA